MAIEYEQQLYAPIKSFLEEQGYEVKAEVHFCDLVAVHPQTQETIVVELKKTFNLSLVLQGLKRLKISSQVYLAVEYVQKRPKSAPKWQELIGLCTKLELGLIAVTFFKTKEPRVEVFLTPPTDAPRTRGKKTRRIMKEFKNRTKDHNIGGVTRTKIMTAYREKALRCAYVMSQHLSCSPAFIKEQTNIYNCSNILQKNYYGWYEREKRGQYRLTEEGYKALQQYASVIESWLED